MASKYVDRKSTIQVLASLYKFPYLFDQADKFHFSTGDFVDSFHKIVFNSIHALRAQGVVEVDPIDIDNYLSARPGLQKIFNDNKGYEFLEGIKEFSDLNSFDYYFNRMKKFTLLRALDNHGIDVSWFYNVDSLDLIDLQEQEDRLDKSSLEDISNLISQRIEDIKMEYIGKTTSESKQAGDGILELLESLKETPEIGVPLYGPLINTVSRGARLKKFYLRSAPTGAGKTRMMVADSVNFAANEIYDTYEAKWKSNGTAEPTLFITTELEIDEVQTMSIAFLSAVDEAKILNGQYDNDDEWNRVIKGAKILQTAPLWIEHLPDFSLRDIESVIRRNVRDNGVKYVAFDYIHSSLKILEEVAQRTNGMKLREDNILFMLAIRLKDLCNELGIFIMSGTQLNADWEDRQTSNQNVLRGAKAIADKIDLGIITLPTTEADKEAIQAIIAAACMPMPNLVHHIYKNRRGKFKSVKLWCQADFSTCRVEALFMTDDNYKIIEVEDLDIVVEEVTF
jgi:replicative DNA helicase